MTGRTPDDVIWSHGILPVVVIDHDARATDLGEAIKAGGLRCVEVTLRTASALEAIRVLSADQDLVVGAGTVLSPEQANLAKASGARFVVTPGMSEAVIAECRRLGLSIYPGVATASELLRAHELGLEIVKFFPAEVLGGVTALKALGAPFPMMRFIPTGGVNEANMEDYLSLSSVFAVGGTWLAKPDLLASGRFDEIRQSVARAVAIVERARAMEVV